MTTSAVTSTAIGTGVANMIAKSLSSDSTSTGLTKEVTKESLDAIINQGKIEASKTSIYTNAAARIAAMTAGTYTGTADWEVSASYLAKTGQPFFVSIDSSTGGVTVTRQRDSDLENYNQAQKDRLAAAMDQLDQLVVKQNANLTNEALKTKLQTAADDYQQIENYGSAATESWQYSANVMRSNMVPFKLALDADGNVTTLDQTKGQYGDDVDAVKKLKLQNIVSQWQDAVSTGIYTELWQVEAKSAADLGDSFYFDLDNAGNIKVQSNTADNVTPDFLNEDPYPKLGADAQWQKDALAFAKAGTAFYLDIDPQTQGIVAKELTAQNIITWNKGPAWQQTDQVGAIVSMFA